MNLQLLLPSTTATSSLLPPRLRPSPSHRLPRPVALDLPRTHVPHFLSRAASFSPTPPSSSWLVGVDSPPGGASSSRVEVIDYYVDTLAKVVGSVRDAQACICDASWEKSFWFRCDVDEETSHRLASLPEVLSVRRVAPSSSNNGYDLSSSSLSGISRPDIRLTKFSPSGLGGNGKHWLVRMEKPVVEVVSKVQMVDYYVETLKRVLKNTKDAQVSIYNISWEKSFGFCCHIDEDCAEELADVPGVLSVCPDLHYCSESMDYGGAPQKEMDSLEFTKTNQTTEVRTKRLFVTGLSFYTSEKTLRAAFEVFGELEEVKVIIDKISKRSKGYAFIGYKAEAAAGAALKEMNGKIINGWMITVDVAKSNLKKNNRARSFTTQGYST